MKSWSQAVSRLNERLTGIQQWVAGETFCLSKENKKLRSELPEWRQDQKEEATCNQKAESQNRISFGFVNTLQSLKKKKGTGSSQFSEHQRTAKRNVLDGVR